MEPAADVVGVFHGVVVLLCEEASVRGVGVAQNRNKGRFELLEQCVSVPAALCLVNQNAERVCLLKHHVLVRLVPYTVLERHVDVCHDCLQG